MLRAATMSPTLHTSSSGSSLLDLYDPYEVVHRGTRAFQARVVDRRFSSPLRTFEDD
eukprot:CAMPEP_0184660216 /NCGR_PEP_ID=MMETSP0308-20130426/32921_1 /TAXON_ID=38269 /ORGANISM="Gloeochaete witrockiana, Strain SAG 46.84" /LENGTH=56 /DNA_ID=CAMNT_0027100623 /DNA_START=15 /DNA_END=185 /DNA_ORIENTATION=-